MEPPCPTESGGQVRNRGRPGRFENLQARHISNRRVALEFSDWDANDADPSAPESRVTVCVTVGLTVVLAAVNFNQQRRGFGVR